MKTFIEIKQTGDRTVVAEAIENIKDALEPHADRHGYYKHDELHSMLGDLIFIEKSSIQRTKRVA